MFSHDRYYKAGFNLLHLVDPLNVFVPKSKTGNAAWWDPFGGMSGTNALDDQAKKDAQDALAAPVPKPPTPADAAKNVTPYSVANAKRPIGRSSTITHDPGSLGDQLTSLLGGGV